MDYREPSLRDVLRRVAFIMIPAWALLLLTFIIPNLNSAGAPYVDLTGWIGAAAYGVAESGGPWGVPAVGVLLLTVLLSRPGGSWKRRGIEAGVILVVLGVVLGGSAYLNEHYLKPALGIHRPNITQLAHTPPDAPPAQTALGQTAKAFYALPDKETRSEALRASQGFQTFPLHPLVRAHWIAETGFSFPSGHSLSALLFAAFFLALGLSVLAGWRRRLFYAVVPWAVLVCYSRPILRVHSPTDITVGGIEGLVLGLAAFVVTRAVLSRTGGGET